MYFHFMPRVQLSTVHFSVSYTLITIFNSYPFKPSNHKTLYLNILILHLQLKPSDNGIIVIERQILEIF